MTTTTTHTCDRCGLGILDGRSLLVIECGPLRSRHETIDLCAICAAALSTWLGKTETTDAP